MFTGIIQAVGKVVGAGQAPRRHPSGGLAHRLEIDLAGLGAHTARNADQPHEGRAGRAALPAGASVAVNGVCLTLAEPAGSRGVFDVVPETWRRTTLAGLRVGDAVNLEASVRVGDPLDGHFVQGHVEGVGTVERVDRNGGEWKLWVRTDAELLPAIVTKGSIAIDGVSLTVADLAGERFSVALVPTTLERTVLGERRAGDAVNIETDILARLVLARLEPLTRGRGGPGLTLETLRAGGYAS